MTLKTTLTTILILFFTYGCASRKVYFDSQPKDVVVSVDSNQCITPCTMKIDCDSRHAVFANESDERITAEIPACDKFKNFEYEATKATGTTLQAAAIPFGVIAALSYTVSIIDNEEGEFTIENDAGLIACGSALVAVLLYSSGEIFHYLNSKEDTPTVRVVFQTEKDPTLEKLRKAYMIENNSKFFLIEEDFNRLFQ